MQNKRTNQPRGTVDLTDEEKFNFGIFETFTGMNAQVLWKTSPDVPVIVFLSHRSPWVGSLKGPGVASNNASSSPCVALPRGNYELIETERSSSKSRISREREMQ